MITAIGEYLATIITKTLKSEWFIILNNFIDDFATVDNWYAVRQNAKLYFFIENDIVIFLLIDDYNKARISSLLKYYKEAAVFLFKATISLFEAVISLKPVKRCL